jgi:predicted nucleic acid-binding protein
MPTGPIVPDTSAWVEFLRGTGSPAHKRLRALVRTADPIVITEPVAMELLAGARNREERSLIRRLVAGCDFAPVAPGDWEDAATLYRQMRGAGRTIRNMLDCLIAVVAMRIDAPVLHADADFDAIAEHAPLKIA